MPTQTAKADVITNVYAKSFRLLEAATVEKLLGSSKSCARN
jgi:hypothetical protein